MNYRHAYHAGNFADCMKHALLVWLLEAMARKPAPFFVLDTHAGAGHYDLDAVPATRTREAEGGIRRLLSVMARVEGVPNAPAQAPLPAPPPPSPLPVMRGLVPRNPALTIAASHETHPENSSGGDAPDKPAHDLGGEEAAQVHRDGGRETPLTPYLALVRCLGLYPGSPSLTEALLRPGDRLACCELHPEDAAELRHLFARNPAVSVHHRDAWEALRGLLPPKQKRALILIDPPFEDTEEFTHLAKGLALGHSRFPSGVFVAWYPIKRLALVRQFLTAMRDSGIRDIVTAEFLLREPLDPARLNGCGLLVVNPPFQFEPAATAILTDLLDAIGTGEPGQGVSVTRIANE